MSDKTTRLNLPRILPAQAQKHVTHNEALEILDRLVQTSVITRDLSSPPTSPQEGDCYLVANEATDEWSGWEDNLACFVNNAWINYAPVEGWLVWNLDTMEIVVYQDTTWQPITTETSVNPVSLLGVNTTADEVNRLSVSSPGTLFNHIGEGHQIRVNKAEKDDVGSILFQTGFSGRAEIGLVGDDDLHLKVTADGEQWNEALVANSETGAVLLPNTVFTPNILPDSGRFISFNSNATLSGVPYQQPSYISQVSGASSELFASFRHNNSSFGGTAEELDPSIIEFVTKYKTNTNGRRFGADWHAIKFTQRPTAPLLAPLSHDQIDFGLVLTTRSTPVSYQMTASCYIKVISGEVLINTSNSNRVYVEGERIFGNQVVRADVGWQHTLFHPKPNSFGYNFRMLDVLASVNSEVAVALPTFMVGEVILPSNVGIHPSVHVYG